MKIYRAKDYNDMSRKAANLISAQILLKPNCVLGLATGSTPLGTYRQLVERYNQGDLDFSEITTVNLDEYKGLTHDNSQSYYYFMNENLFSKVNINKSKVFLPDGTEPDSETACQKYNEILTEAAAFLLALIALMLLIGILRQIKRLNKGLGNIIGNIQAYFDVILREEEEEEQSVQVQAQVQDAQEEKGQALEKEQKKMEEEQLVNAVLQEYFS
jgi:hypothetical protein